MINPDDIPEALLDASFIHARGEGPSQRWSIAEILNAAIEAGVVLPPCHYIRHNGKMVKVSGRVRLWPGSPEMDHHGHWKGESK